MPDHKNPLIRIEAIESEIATRLTHAVTYNAAIHPADLAQLAYAELCCAQAREAFEHVRESSSRRRRNREQTRAWRLLRGVMTQAMPAIEAQLAKLAPRPCPEDANRGTIEVKAQDLQRGQRVQIGSAVYTVEAVQISDEKYVAVRFTEGAAGAYDFDHAFQVLT